MTGLGVSVESIAFSPDGQLLISGSRGGRITIWDISSGANKFTIEQTDCVDSISLSPRGTILASITSQRSMNLWDLPRCGPQQNNKDERGDLSELIISPDETFVASKTGARIILWDALTGKRLFSLLGDWGIDNLVFLSDSQVIAAMCKEGLRIWSTSTGKLVRVFQFDWHGFSLEFSTDGTQMAPDFESNVMRLLDLASSERLETVTGDYTFSNAIATSGIVEIIAFSRDKKLVAVSQDQRSISVWDTISRTLLSTVQTDP